MTMKRFLISTVVFLIFSGLAKGGGLRSNIGMVSLENLRVGKTYSIFNLASQPLKVVNTTGRTVKVKIKVGYPDAFKLRKGHEVIPDISWVKLEKDEFRLGPGEMAVADFTISIPNDDTYVGKKYQFYIWSGVVEMAGAGGMPIFPAVQGFVCFTIAPVKAGISDEEAEEIRANLAFSVVPYQMVINGVEVGKKYDIAELAGKQFKLINPNDETFTYKMEIIPVRKSMMRLARGYKDCPDSSSVLIIDEPVFEVKGNSIKKKKIYIQFPKEDKYRGQKYDFIIYTYVLNQKIISGLYSEVLVTTNP